MNGKAMNQPDILVVLNQASRDELQQLPGIGPRLAERILAVRPFDSLDDVKSVKGITEALLERLSAVATTPDALPASAPEPAAESPAESRLPGVKEAIGEKGRAISEGLAQLGEEAGKRGQAARQAVQAFPDKVARTARSGGLLWALLISSAASALNAILLTLAILGGINGGLTFATASQAQTMQRQVTQLSSGADVLRQDLDGLRVRVDTLEGLGSRTVALEKAQQKMSADLQSASDQVAAMQDQITALDGKVSQQEQRTLQFENFLHDLQTLINNLFAPQGGNQ
jgi:hypothetical protein